MQESTTTVLRNPWLKNYNPKLVRKEIAPNFYGVFTKEDIKEGELIFTNWNDSCTRLTKSQIKKLSLPYREVFEKYSTEIEPYVYVGPYENEDIELQIDYFINHCCDPNGWLVNDSDVAARRDIKAGEQITIDYATFIIHEFDSSRIDECLCGSANCRGSFKNTDWWRLRNVYKGHFISWIQQKIDKKEQEKLLKVKTSS
jgi:SET domain-containing protein